MPTATEPHSTTSPGVAERRSALDSMIQIVAPRYWIALAAVGVLLLGVVAWSIFGRIQTTVDGDGVLLTGGSVQQVHVSASGVVEAVAVQVGADVSAGESLGSIKLANGTTVSVTSPTAGVVSSVQVTQGQAVQVGTVMLTLANPAAPLELVGTVAAETANQVQIGAEVRVVPSGTNSTGLETLPGHVLTISPLPVSPAELSAQVGSEALATALIDSGGGSVKSVTVALDDVTVSSNGFLVTNSHGDQTLVQFGMQASFQIVTSSEAPIDKVIK